MLLIFSAAGLFFVLGLLSLRYRILVWLPLAVVGLGVAITLGGIFVFGTSFGSLGGCYQILGMSFLGAFVGTGLNNKTGPSWPDEPYAEFDDPKMSAIARVLTILHLAAWAAVLAGFWFGWPHSMIIVFLLGTANLMGLLMPILINLVLLVILSANADRMDNVLNPFIFLVGMLVLQIFSYMIAIELFDYH